MARFSANLLAFGSSGCSLRSVEAKELLDCTLPQSGIPGDVDVSILLVRSGSQCFIKPEFSFRIHMPRRLFPP